MELTAPAKVNFGLRILARRPDGYHELESLFLPIDLADSLRVELREAPGVALALDGDAAGVPVDGRNLAVRAAERFLETTRWPGGVVLGLTKRIPSPGGLGGGSSDAGAVLRALAALLPVALPPSEREVLALSLGADVPFFLAPRPAWVGGIGERIEAAEGIPAFDLLLARPDAALETREVYAAFDAEASAAPASLTTPGVGPSIRALWASRGQGEPQPHLRTWLWNELEPAATRLCPVLAEIRKEIEAAGAVAVSLTGSGPTMFGVFPSAGAAEEAARQLKPRPGLRTWVVKTAPSRPVTGPAGA